MRFKLYVILSIGLFSTFARTIKAEETCYFSNPKEYKKCFNKRSSSKRQAKYPLITYSDGGDIKWISGNGFNGPHATPGAIYKIIELSAPNDNQLKITVGDKKTNIIGIRRKAPFISVKKDTLIDGEDILFWENTAQARGWGLYKFSYINDYGKKKDINYRTFNFTYAPKFRRLEFMNEFFKNLSGLTRGEKREIDSVILKKMNRHLKEYEIIGSIINVTSTEKGCSIANQSKFPELVKKYQKLSNTINPLRAKLGLPELSRIKSLCNVSKAQRPQWMEEKIKGCDKYPTKKQRDYCINIYSPFGKE